ncbi:DUF1295 domain-containing protein [Stappia sp. F7233]|uniref:DUF1295 domain-containing protein n=1 Tax=Stappia albiluteola TaxID=2758565 RepID=A0A839ADH3_9HYPH|nr:DUF1295 domain-containing protein [Stappia albiluteola]MBA5776877.1 DUF1295 domain-containing protein [Stappia albiluteola]
MTTWIATLNPLSTTLVATLLIVSILWRIHVALRDASIIDFYWAPGFLVIALLWLRSYGGVSIISALLLILLAIWAIRLTAHIVLRHNRTGREDARYTAMRDAGGPKWWLRSLVTVFWFQGVILWAVASPIHTLFATSPSASVAWSEAALGVAVFLFGFTFETVADYQLASFLSEKSNREKLYTGGLRAWCRYPAYFGEILVWWGFGLIAHAASGSPWSFAGPLLLTAALMRLSGVSLLERRLSSNKPGYEEWAARTNALIPWPPRKRG